MILCTHTYIYTIYAYNTYDYITSRHIWMLYTYIYIYMYYIYTRVYILGCSWKLNDVGPGSCCLGIVPLSSLDAR